MNEKELETFSSRLTFALNKLRVTQSALARKINVNRQAIQYLCTSKNSSTKFSHNIADALGINIDWLLNGSGPMMFSPEIKQKIAPILLKSQIQDWLKNELSIEDSQEKTTVNEIFSDLAFALKLTDNSMSPRFESNTIIVIEPLAEIIAPCFVLVHIKIMGDIIFRQLLNENNSLILSAYNEVGYKNIELSSEDVVLGRMLEAKWLAF